MSMRKYLLGAIASLLLSTTAHAQPLNPYVLTSAKINAAIFNSNITPKSVAINGATINSNALAVTGTIASSGAVISEGGIRSAAANFALGAAGGNYFQITAGSGTFTSLAGVNNAYLMDLGVTNTNSITLTNMQGILNLGQIWTGTGLRTALRLNVTNTGSDAASKLIDLQTGGVSQFNVLATGTATFGGAVTVPGVTTAALTSTGTFTSGAGASLGTLTNAPAAGNPTSWIKIIDNGVTRYIPAW
jgi:hypothetical protein